jgi:hypothetical protein
MVAEETFDGVPDGVPVEAILTAMQTVPLDGDLYWRSWTNTRSPSKQTVLKVFQLPPEAAHEKRTKHTDNFLSR